MTSVENFNQMCGILDTTLVCEDCGLGPRVEKYRWFKCMANHLICQSCQRSNGFFVDFGLFLVNFRPFLVQFGILIWKTSQHFFNRNWSTFMTILNSFCVWLVNWQLQMTLWWKNLLLLCKLWLKIKSRTCWDGKICSVSSIILMTLTFGKCEKMSKHPIHTALINKSCTSFCKSLSCSGTTLHLILSCKWLSNYSRIFIPSKSKSMPNTYKHIRTKNN